MEKEFKISRKWMGDKYEQFNQELFGGVLPRIEFGLSNATSHAGWARCVKYNSSRTVKPVKILMSTYHAVTEEIAVNTLLHEMIHICDYVTHPEHFFDPSYDSHKSSFFQDWMRRINGVGYNVTEHVTSEENASAMSHQSKKAANTNAIAGILLWDNGRNCDVFWTERKYLENVVAKNSDNIYDSIVFCKVNDASILTMPECKGKATRRNLIASVPVAQLTVRFPNKEIQLPGYKKVDIKSMVLTSSEKDTILSNLDSIRMRFADQLDYAVYENGLGRFINSRGEISLSSEYIALGKSKKCQVSMREGKDGLTMLDYKGVLFVSIPMRKEIADKIREMAANAQSRETNYDKTIREITKDLWEELEKLPTAETMINENKHNDRLSQIVEDTIREFVGEVTGDKEHKLGNMTDKSIVDVKRISDDAEIVTQW